MSQQPFVLVIGACMQLEWRALRSQLSFAAEKAPNWVMQPRVHVRVSVLAGLHTTARWAIGRVTSS